jgi:hypothetical protein
MKTVVNWMRTLPEVNSITIEQRQLLAGSGATGGSRLRTTISTHTRTQPAGKCDGCGRYEEPSSTLYLEFEWAGGEFESAKVGRNRRQRSIIRTMETARRRIEGIAR